MYKTPTMNKILLPTISMLIVLAFSFNQSSAQCFTQVFHTSGTELITETNVTVIKEFGATTETDYCPEVTQPYFIDAGLYRFKFSPSCDSIKLNFSGITDILGNTEEVILRVNGSHYAILKEGDPNGCDDFAVLTNDGNIKACNGCNLSGWSNTIIPGPIDSIEVIDVRLSGMPNGAVFSLSFCNSSVDEDNDGFSIADGDCDDSNPDVNPGLTEIPYDGLDNDCNPMTPDDDLDADGLLFTDDCDDMDNTIAGPLEWWPDNDGDGNGNSMVNPIIDCVGPDGWVNNNNDSDDTVNTNDLLLYNALKIYPQPVGIILTVELQSNVNFEELQILDIYGNKLYTSLKPKETNKIDVSSFTSGIYIIKAQSGSKQAVKIICKK